MAKKSGLGHRFYMAGFDISGDVGSISKAANPSGVLGVTGIDKSGHERVLGLVDGELSWAGFFNDATDQMHDALKGLVKTSRIASWLLGTTAGDQVANLVGRQMNYDYVREAGGHLTNSCQLLSDSGFGLEWAELLAAKGTHSSATDETGIQDSNHATKAISTSSVADPSVITTSGAHGLASGMTVVIAGHAGSTPSINSTHVVTVLNATTFSIPVNVTVGGTGGTAQRSMGGVGFLHHFPDGTPTGTIEYDIEDSSDSSDGDDGSWANLLAFSDVVTPWAAIAERITVAGVVEQWARASTNGTFTVAPFSMSFKRNVR